MCTPAWLNPSRPCKRLAGRKLDPKYLFVVVVGEAPEIVDNLPCLLSLTRGPSAVHCHDALQELLVDWEVHQADDIVDYHGLRTSWKPTGRI